VQGRDLDSVARDVERAVQSVSFPLEYHAVLLGEYAERQAAQQRLLIAGLIVALGAFLLLQAAFQSWRLAAMTSFTLPLALVGGLVASMLAGGGALSLGSLVGLIAVLGIAIRNGILLISHFQHLEHEEGEPLGAGLVLRGARERLAPIVTSALATGVALAPVLLLGNVPGLEIWHPIAVAILGGLVSVTLFSLFIIPGLYLRFAPRAVAPLEHGA
jgi:Cu/Ag efflux pump CusA